MHNPDCLGYATCSYGRGWLRSFLCNRESCFPRKVSLKDTRKAIDCFLSPDPNSANPANGGRRIERVPGGYFILNAAEHRRTLNREIQREQTRLRVARHREKQKDRLYNGA